MPAPPRAGPWRRLAVHLVLAYLTAWLVGTGFGAALRTTASWSQGAAWEREMLLWFHARPLHAVLDAIVLAVPYTGTNLTLLPAMIVSAGWLWKRHGHSLIALQLLVVSVGSLSLNALLKYQLDRSRPDLFPRRGMYAWASYPSGHAIVSIALFFTIALLLHRVRGWRWPFAAALLLYAANCHSRLYLAVHWPTDLIGGTLIGLAWLAGTWYAFSRAAAHPAASSDDAGDEGGRSVPAR